jgi:phosphoglycolate phosphatase-like HAD superfamily hydrolase
MSPRILALDFDGVICDSGPEVFLIALRTYTGMRPNAGLRGVLDGLGGLRGQAASAAIASEPLYRQFAALMPLGNRAEDFGVELAALEAGADLQDQPAYDAFYADLGRDFLETFHRRFYDERRATAAASLEDWLALMSTYPEFLEVLRRRSHPSRLAIATAKDRESVERLLRHFGIADLFSPTRIFDKEAGRNKRAHLEKVSSACNCSFADITFVDDKVNHLESVESLGVRCVLAAWGYNGARERRLAHDKGYRVCDLADVEKALFD